MKNPQIYLLAILVLLSASSCQDLYFKSPQPKGNPHLSEVPAELQGNFIAVGDFGDESKLYYHIEASGFVVYEEEKLTVHKDSLETNDVYIQDSLIYIKGEDIAAESNGFPFELKDDSVYVSFYRWEETNLMPGQAVLTFDRNRYYLHDFSEEKKAWDCVQIEQIKNGDLLVWSSDVKKEETLIKKYLKAEKRENNSDEWIADPSKSQFRKFVKEKGFGELVFFLHKLDNGDIPDYMAVKLGKK